MPESRHIVAIGGGGFADTSSNFAIDAYILSLARNRHPRVGLIPTATGDDSRQLSVFMAAYGGLDCRPGYLPLFSRTPELARWVFEQDVIFVGGGNTLSMLAVWKAWGLDQLLPEALARGTVLAGQSAGAICWFEQGVSDSWAGSLRALDCLGLLPGSCCPHYASEAQRKPIFRKLVQEGDMQAGIAIDDGAAVHFVDGKLTRVLSWRKGATAYHVEKGTGSQVCEEPIEPEKLNPLIPDWPVR
ncbi:MAG: Type 1 glutamine amidotransferase-like domain-containing protein [Bradyrhizobium sp.]